MTQKILNMNTNEANGRFKTMVILSFNIFTAFIKELIYIFICNIINIIIHRTCIKIYK